MELIMKIEQYALRQAYIHSFFNDASNEIISSKDSCHGIDTNTFGRYQEAKYPLYYGHDKNHTHDTPNRTLNTPRRSGKRPILVASQGDGYCMRG